MEVIVRTDHRPLSFVKAGSEHNRKLARWWAELQNYNVRVEYLPGKKIVVADTLSRLTTASGGQKISCLQARSMMILMGTK